MSSIESLPSDGRQIEPALQKQTSQQQNTRTRQPAEPEQQQSARHDEVQKEEDSLQAERMQAWREKQTKKKDEQLEEIKEAANELLESLGVTLEYSVNRELDELIVNVKSKESGEVIRQIPPEYMLRIAERLKEMSGVILDEWS